MPDPVHRLRVRADGCSVEAAGGPANRCHGRLTRNGTASCPARVRLSSSSRGWRMHVREVHGFMPISAGTAAQRRLHATAPHPEGRGAEQALRLALRDAGVGPESGGPCERTRDLDPAQRRRRGRDDPASARLPVTVTSTKGVTGHALGRRVRWRRRLPRSRSSIRSSANGQPRQQDAGIEVDVVAQAGRHQPVEVAVSNSFGFGGQNAVLVLTPGSPGRQGESSQRPSSAAV